MVSSLGHKIGLTESCSFFKHYHPQLAILDPMGSPDACYKTSTFVFWCVVITGSRKYDADPTLLDRLAPGVASLARKSLSCIASFLPTICGLSILSAWPLPMKSVLDDPSLLYTGAAMQLALQHGLHTSFKKPNGAIDVAHEATLARVWSYLEFVCHW